MSEEVKKKLIDPMEFEESSPYAEKKPKKTLKEAMVFDEITKSFEDKAYIVLIRSEADDLFDGKYKICTGRTECYRYIQDLIESYGDEIDVHESIVITETKQTETKSSALKYYLMSINDSISIYSFCKSVEENYSNIDFSIDNYFSPPSSERTHNITNTENIYAHVARIEDPIMAQAALDTFKEKQENMKSLLSFPSKVEKIIKDSDNEPYITLDDDPMNI